MMFSISQISHVTHFLWISNKKTDDFVEGTGPENDPTFQDFEGDALDDISHQLQSESKWWLQNLFGNPEKLGKINPKVNVAYGSVFSNVEKLKLATRNGYDPVEKPTNHATADSIFDRCSHGSSVEFLFLLNGIRGVVVVLPHGMFAPFSVGDFCSN